MSKQLIEALGGAKQLAADLRASPGAVRNWMLGGRSIPWRYRPAIAKIAAERGVPLPEDFWQVAAA
jgi:DNA-binding transcriptional regulator YdaS (Cro superfamily)